jgi:L-ascorbate metabolism protein UlaG (beta-lactamase superfamily)
MMLTGKDLIADIDSCEVKAGQVAIWWLGQHSFVVKLGRKVIYIDPFLTPMERRQVPPLLAPQDVTNATLICGTHDHVDHIDREVWPALAQASPAAKFVVPDLLREGLARDLGIPVDRFVGLDDGQSRTIGGIEVSAVAAAHEFLDPDPASGRHPYLGYVIHANGCRIYHSGDSCVYEGLQTKLKKWRLDVVFLPINGRDAVRLTAGCIGNMTYQEAADLAGTLQPGLTIPAHYEMFGNNSQDPVAFLDYMNVKYPRLRAMRLGHGERLIYNGD